MDNTKACIEKIKERIEELKQKREKWEKYTPSILQWVGSEKIRQCRMRFWNSLWIVKI